MTNATIFNMDQVEAGSQPMFFGEQLGVARNDVIRYPVLDKATETMKSFFWNPLEISLQKDVNDFKTLADHERHIFTKNISYQIMLDSVQERAPVIALLPWVTLPELEGAILWWTSFEQIHSKSYQWILQNVFPNPSVTFDTITLDPNIVDRAKAIIKFYDDFISYSNDVKAMGFGDHVLTSVNVAGETVTRQVSLNLRELKRRLYLALMSVYVLESIRFYVSFACSFAFGQRGIMVGNANIIKLIARDEAQHVGLVINILKNLIKHEDDYAQIATEVNDEVMVMFDEAVAQEREWIKYLFKDGSLIGLNETLLNQYLEHIANKRLKTAGFKPRYEGQQNPFGWLSSWLSTEDYQVAPQEQEITDYLIGAINSDVDDSNLIDF